MAKPLKLALMECAVLNTNELTFALGRGWRKRNLAQCFEDTPIVQTLSAQLSRSHFTLLSAIEGAITHKEAPL
ncbi:hypothetical protein [Marinagarivorans algicola]|uniref:hypothetical protein n=1 Tax=Marinagarivorans algicola TaxID=1513270 RepID=UPI00155DACF2|nr:hypothetical protein [Marinagarivorans algicola]